MFRLILWLFFLQLYPLIFRISLQIFITTLPLLQYTNSCWLTVCVHTYDIQFSNVCTNKHFITVLPLNHSNNNNKDRSVVRACVCPVRGRRGFDPRPRHTKDVIKIYKMLPCLTLSISAYMSGFYLLSHLVKESMDTIWNERSREINISLDNLFRKRS